MKIQGAWNNKELTLHINCLELLAAWYTRQAFVHEITNQTILLWLDNRAYINHMGGTHSRSLADLAIQLVPEEEHLSSSDTHCREGKCVCRSDVSFLSRSYKLDAKSESVKQHQSTVVPSGGRSIRHKTVNSFQEILHLETRTSSRESGRISTGLVDSQRLYTSPMVLDFKVPEGQRSTSNTSLNYP